MRILVDNGLSPVIASTLNDHVARLGHAATHIRDLPCGPHAADAAWMDALRATGDDWLVLTGNLRMSRNRSERRAFAQADLKGIVLAPGYRTMPVHRQGSMILQRWPDIEEAATRFQAPFLFELPVRRSAGLRTLPR